MELASTEKVVLGSIAFAIFWVLAVFPAVPFLPIGRTAGSLLGATLMVIFKVITPHQAYVAIDLPILGLLFGTMVVSEYLERADIFKYLGILLSWKSKGAKDLLCRICIISAISSALFNNDTSCVVLTKFILKIASQNNIPPLPFLLALASSANIGSSATPIGNPQNLVIASKSKISFGGFLVGILPAMVVGVFVNALILLCMYWKLLSHENDEENCAPKKKQKDVENALDEMNFSESNTLLGGVIELTRNSNASKEVAGGDNFSQTWEETFTSRSGLNGKMEMMDGPENAIPVESVGEKERFAKRWRRLVRKTCVYLVTIGMLIALLMGLDMSWTALTAALTLVVLDFEDAQPCLEKVSYSLLVFFCGMFITVDGFNRTGIPSTFWSLMEPYARINHVSGIAVLSLVVLLLSNVTSNVPTVLLLGARVAESAAAISPAEEKKAWLILAWTSTVAGNLSLLGSAANLIVCEQARSSKFFGYTLSFWNHLKFGLPSTLIVTAIGLTLVRA